MGFGFDMVKSFSSLRVLSHHISSNAENKSIVVIFTFEKNKLFIPLYIAFYHIDVCTKMLVHGLLVSRNLSTNNK